MGKLIDEPITLKRPSLRKQEPLAFATDALPRRFVWRGREYPIHSIGGEWRVLGRWWEGEGERRYLRVVTPNGLAMDLCEDVATGHWMLHELQD